MDIRLGDNIRAFRKERGLTQEQLAETLGVTVGAVYKWEAKLSFPELSMLMELADFFDTSVDALLGYAMKDNRLEAAEKRLWSYHQDKDRKGLVEAEKALKKYPNAFSIAYAAATLYHGIGMEQKDKAVLRRALELYEKARQLLPQNRDDTISDQTLCASIGGVYFALGDRENAIQLLKTKNADNHYSAMIGVVLAAELNRPEEAIPYLSKGLMLVFNNLVSAVLGFSSVYRARRDFENGLTVLQWGIRVFQGLKASDKPDYIDKLCSVLYASLAGFQMEMGDRKTARDSIIQAVQLASVFDSMPDYGNMNIRFVRDGWPYGAAYDQLGQSAAEAVENVLKDVGSAELWKLYLDLTEAHDEPSGKEEHS